MSKNNRVEFRRELDNRFEQVVVSFLNYTGGGEIVVGADARGNAVGLADAQAARWQIIDRIGKYIRPRTSGLFNVIIEREDEKDIIRVIVSCGPERPYFIRGFGRNDQGCFTRVGGVAQAMSKQMIEKMSIKRQQTSLQSVLSPRRQLTFKQLCIYYAEKDLDPSEEFIEELELRQSGGEFNLAAYLLADKNSVSIKVAVYAGTDKAELQETREYGNCCLLTAARRVLDRLDSENRTFARITSQNRLEKEGVDSIALREAVINALVHNDYTKGVPSVEIFADKIVVASCGGLVEGLPEADFFNCRSMPRNRELMRVFCDIELAEQLGSGISRILKAYDPSVFEFRPGFVSVTFPLKKAFIPSADKINDKIKATLSIMIKDPQVTIPEIAKLTGKSQSTISREIKACKEAGVLRREGARKNGSWIVEEGVY